MLAETLIILFSILGLSLGWLTLGYLLGKYSVYRKLRTRTKNWLD
jgi:hypothetical protein